MVKSGQVAPDGGTMAAGAYRLLVSLVLALAGAEIKTSVVLNKLLNVKPVGANVGKTFVPLTEIPPPHVPHDHHAPQSGRRHMEDCTQKPAGKDIYGGVKVDIFGEYYDDQVAKTVATVIFPDHIDRKHFEVTSSVPYLTVGPIEAMGYHPSTLKSEHPAECEKIYQDHLADQYSDESTDYSEESLEMARMPLGPEGGPSVSAEEKLEEMYLDDV